MQTSFLGFVRVLVSCLFKSTFIGFQYFNLPKAINTLQIVNFSILVAGVLGLYLQIPIPAIRFNNKLVSLLGDKINCSGLFINTKHGTKI
jgi:hypothetical protein